MKKVILTLFIAAISTLAFAQNQNNVFKMYEDFKESQPTDFVKFQLKKRTGGNVFMTGGITNYRLKKITPKVRTEELVKEVWGIWVNDSVYINSYPYSQVIGYNKIIEAGFYS